MTVVYALILLTSASLLIPPVHPSSSPGAYDQCPNLVITCPDEIPKVGKTYVVTLAIEGGPGLVSYHWRVSGGKLVAGQGMFEIKVRFTKPGKPLTVFVEVGGFANGCQTKTSCTLGRGKNTSFSSDEPNKSLDRSGGGVFRIKPGAAKVGW